MYRCSFDVAIWVKKHIIDVERAKAAAQSGGLKIAGASGDGKHEDTIGIVLSVDKDEATQKAERDKEAAAKRMQNQMPSWHLKSTISGDLTALGIKETAREDTHTNGNGEADKLPKSSDAMLRGLGRPQAPPVQVTAEETKPAVSPTNDVDCACSLSCLCLEVSHNTHGVS